jgi:hypothetical protein
MEFFLREKVVEFPPEWVAEFAGIFTNAIPVNKLQV